MTAIHCRILDDRGHHVRPIHNNSTTYELDATDLTLSSLEGTTVAQFLAHFQQQHRSSNCWMCAKGGSCQLHVKSATLVISRPDRFRMTLLENLVKLHKAQSEDPARLSHTILPMESWQTMEHYLGHIDPASAVIMLECTFYYPLPHESSFYPENSATNNKHKHEDDNPGDLPSASTSLTLPDGLYVVPHEDGSAATPLTIFTPPFDFASYRSHAGAILLDTTLFISEVHKLWKTHPHLMLCAPPGSGISTTTDMLSIWLNKSRDGIEDFKLFSSLKIGQAAYQAPPALDRISRQQHPSPWKWYHHTVCFMLDLESFQWPSHDFEQAIQTFFAEAVRSFATKHAGILGQMAIATQANVTDMFKAIHDHCDKTEPASTFVLIIRDWDAVILKALCSGEAPLPDFNALFKTLVDLQNLFVEKKRRSPTPSSHRMLIAGHLPFGSWDTNIAFRPEIASAFGFSAVQLKALSQMFSAPLYEFECGPYWPSPPSTVPPAKLFNLRLSLNWIAQESGLDSMPTQAFAATLESDSLLRGIAQISSPTLKYSLFLREIYTVAVDSFAPLSGLLLQSLHRNPPVSWQILTYLGGISLHQRVLQKPGTNNKYQFDRFGSAHAQRQILQIIPSVQLEPPTTFKELALQAAAEGDAQYLLAMMEDNLGPESIFDLHEMREVCLQVMLGTIYRTNSGLLSNSSSQYLDCYLPQFGLLTGGNLHTNRRGKQSGLPLSGFKETGRLDALFVLKHIHAIIAIELKEFTLWGLRRGELTNDEKCNEAFEPQNIYATSEKIINKVHDLPLDKLRSIKYGHRYAEPSAPKTLITKVVQIGHMLDDAVEQVTNYMVAARQGKLAAGEKYRCEVVNIPPVDFPGPQDRIEGYVIAAIARRPIAIRVTLEESTPASSSSWEYQVKTGWVGSWQFTKKQS
uniref:Uncharacterized protein n=1 Tax=Mycena chlorophos TaxID=658473 RepID=A0ABQ0M793_MYCCL|nr:predicted protein [Mycena chlorophos]